MDLHYQFIRLIVAYTLTGALLFTVVITCGSLLGWVKFADSTQQQRLFVALILEIAVAAAGSFTGILTFNPQKVQSRVLEKGQLFTLATELGRYKYALQIEEEFLANNWTTLPTLEKLHDGYNAAITDLLDKEAAYLAVLESQQADDQTKQFLAIMQTVKHADAIVHGLNDEFERVLTIKSPDTKVAESRAHATAEKLRPLAKTLEQQIQQFLTTLTNE